MAISAAMQEGYKFHYTKMGNWLDCTLKRVQVQLACYCQLACMMLQRLILQTIYDGLATRIFRQDTCDDISGYLGSVSGSVIGMATRLDAHSHAMDRSCYGIRVPSILERNTVPPSLGKDGWGARPPRVLVYVTIRVVEVMRQGSDK